MADQVAFRLPIWDKLRGDVVAVRLLAIRKLRSDASISRSMQGSLEIRKEENYGGC
jgi:hypothetical protein